MKISFSAVALATATLLSSVPVLAHEVVYVGTFSGAAESPPNASAGTGSFTVTFDLDLATMRVEASFSGLTGNVSAAHIHCCTAVAGVGTAGVATVTPTFTAFPLGGTFGTYDHTFDLSVASSYNAAFITDSDTTPANPLDNVSLAMNALLNGAAAGKAYFNIHTNIVLGGEVRGFLAAAPVPEPGTYALMLGGLALLGVAARRKQA